MKKTNNKGIGIIWKTYKTPLKNMNEHPIKGEYFLDK